MRFKIFRVSLCVVIFSFPAVCFSELKTVVNETCNQYQGDLNDKKELEDFRQLIKRITIVEGILRSDESIKQNLFISDDDMAKISKYPEKVTTISHTEKGNEICDKLKITFEPEGVYKYIRQMETSR